MSRLDRFITRLLMQRCLLDHHIAALNATVSTAPGPVIELGLGNGRTYHHLKEKLTDRRIVVFDRELGAHPASHPAAGDLILGDISETGAAYAREQGGTAALVHADLGNGRPEYDTKLRSWLPHVAHALLRPGGLFLTSTEVTHPGLVSEPLPPDAPDYEYFVYRKV
jgi:hypothetical protein